MRNGFATPHSMNKGMGVRLALSAIPLAVAVFLAWLAWGVLNPAVQAAIPAGDWHDLLGIACTILIAWGGGVGLPLVFFIMAIYLFIVLG